MSSPRPGSASIPCPPAQGRRAFGFTTFAGGLEACRKILRRGATPAVLRLYDQTESGRNFDQPDTNVLIVLDEADPALLSATLAVVDDECARRRTRNARPRARRALARPPQRRLGTGARCGAAGIVVDTAEISGPWAALPGLFDEVIAALTAIDGHPRRVGAPVPRLYRRRLPVLHVRRARTRGRRRAWRERYYRQAWDDGDRRHVGPRCGHQPPPRHRAQPVPVPPPRPRPGLRGASPASRRRFDPAGILNPGKLGLPSPFGPAPWA